MPEWSTSATLTPPGGSQPRAVRPGPVAQTRQWAAGDTVVLDIDMPVRVTRPHPRVDAVRGCVAVERGPLVYCVETADLPDGVELEDVRWDAGREPTAVERPDLGDHVVGVRIPITGDAASTMDAIPYFTWANREVAAMRVWIPTC